MFPVLASNFGGGIFFAVFVVLPAFYGSIPVVFVIVLRRLLWFKRSNEMPAVPLQLGTLWCSSTLATLVFIMNEIVELDTPTIVWIVLLSVSMAVIGYTLVRIRRDPHLNCWRTWILGIILPGIAMSLTAMLRIWQ